MSDPAIRVEGLGKRYRIGSREPYKNLRDVLADAMYAPLRRASTWYVHHQVAERDGRTTRAEWIWALKEVGFEIKQGEVVGVIGRNGAGKSTLLKILSRITKPTEGYAEIRGRVGSLLEVGTGFHPELSGRENVYLNGAIIGMKRSEIDRRFDEIVAFAEMDQFIDTPVKRYSSGMYLRLAFAVAAHLEPEILLVDEVLAVGDVAFQRKCMGKMGDVAREGRTILFVSHSMAAIQALCPRTILLGNGVVWKDASTSEAIGTYLQSLEVSASENLLERRARSGRGQVRLRQVDVIADDKDSRGTLVTGRPARLVFYLTNVLPGLSCIFTIYDHFGGAIAHFTSTSRSEEDYRDSSLEACFVCELDELSLVPGRYRINAAVLSDGELQDHVEAAAVFEVEEGMLRGRPATGDSGYGSVLLHHRWIHPASPQL